MPDLGEAQGIVVEDVIGMEQGIGGDKDGPTLVFSCLVNLVDLLRSVGHHHETVPFQQGSLFVVEGQQDIGVGPGYGS
jgi:hypothetical protein